MDQIARKYNKYTFLNTFKSRLDRFMTNEDIYYSDFRAELSFTSGTEETETMKDVWNESLM